MKFIDLLDIMLKMISNYIYIRNINIATKYKVFTYKSF